MEEASTTPKTKPVLILGAVIFLVLLTLGGGYLLRSRTAPSATQTREIPDLPQFSGEAIMGVQEQSAQWETSISPDQAKAYYQKQLETSGWTIVSAGPGSLTARNANTTYELTFSSTAGNKTSVSLKASFGKKQ